MDDICRAKVPLRILVRELRWENEHRKLTGTESPRALENLGILWKLFKECSSLFQEDEALQDKLGDEETVVKVKELRQTVTTELNKAYELLTESLGGDRIVNRIDAAHKVASNICEEAVLKLEVELDTLSGDVLSK